MADSEPIMENPFSPSSLSPKLAQAKTVSDIKECIIEMKQEMCDTATQITDDSQNLQRFCAKLEYLLQAEQKSRSSLLGGKKDYWNYICDCLSSNKGLGDGVKFVKSLSELRTSLGKGRAFIRFALMHQRLADTLQQCTINTKVTSEWYHPKALWLQPELSGQLINALYDLNDIQFDLSPRGYDLDTAWPSFARKQGGGSWKPPSRSTSVNSLASISTQSDDEESNDITQEDLSASLTASSPLAEDKVDQLKKELHEVETDKIDLSYQVQNLDREKEDQKSKAKDLESQLLQVQQRCNGLQVQCGILETELKLKEQSWDDKEKLMNLQIQEANMTKSELQSQLTTLGLENIDQLKSYLAESSDLKMNLLTVMEHNTGLEKQVQGLQSDIETKEVIDDKKNRIIELLENKLNSVSKRTAEAEEKYLAEVNNKEKLLTGKLEFAKKLKELEEKLEVELHMKKKLLEANEELRKMLHSMQEKSQLIATTAKEKVYKYVALNKELKAKLEAIETQQGTSKVPSVELDKDTMMKDIAAKESVLKDDQGSTKVQDKDDMLKDIAQKDQLVNKDQQTEKQFANGNVAHLEEDMLKDIAEKDSLILKESTDDLEKDAMMKDIAQRDSVMKQEEKVKQAATGTGGTLEDELMKDIAARDSLLEKGKQEQMLSEKENTEISKQEFQKSSSEKEEKIDLEAFLESEQKEAEAAKEREIRMEAEKKALQDEYNKFKLEVEKQREELQQSLHATQTDTDSQGST